MRKTKYHIYLNSEERRLIADGRYTDLVDEVLIKTANAKRNQSNFT